MKRVWIMAATFWMAWGPLGCPEVMGAEWAAMSGAITIKGKEVKCKEVKEKSDCNTCTFERCTDGEKQWDSEARSCTAMMCGPVTIPYNPEDWK